jgi:hypothetical protein
MRSFERVSDSSGQLSGCGRRRYHIILVAKPKARSHTKKERLSRVDMDHAGNLQLAQRFSGIQSESCSTDDFSPIAVPCSENRQTAGVSSPIALSSTFWKDLLRWKVWQSVLYLHWNIIRSFRASRNSPGPAFRDVSEQF